jgi:hypothetical protein
MDACYQCAVGLLAGQMMSITASNVEAVNALLLPDFSAQE